MMEVFSEEWLLSCGFPAMTSEICADGFRDYPLPGRSELDRAVYVLDMIVGWSFLEVTESLPADATVRERCAAFADVLNREGWDWWLVWRDSDPTVRIRGRGAVGDTPELVGAYWR
jgi:hypothetical protein